LRGYHAARIGAGRGGSPTDDATQSRNDIDALRLELTQLRTQVEATRRREDWLRRNTTALANLSHSPTLDERGLPAALAEILEVDARLMDVARVGVWLFDDSRQRLDCVSLFDRSQGPNAVGQPVSAAQFPAYFAAVETARVIDAGDAARDPRTRELALPYLKPSGISSLLDAPLRVFGRSAGVLCHEHVGPPRMWTAEEIAFAATMAGFVALALERNERREAEQVAFQTETRYRDLFERARVLAVMLDMQGRVTYVNQYFLTLLGRRREELMGRDCFPLIVSPEEVDAIRALFFDTTRRDEVLATYENEIVTASGERRRIFWTNSALRDAHGNVTGTASLGIDLTERVRLEAELAQARKHESLGRLASGVAHDFNNLLTVILCSTDLAGDALSRRSKAQPHLASVRKAAERAAEVTKGLLAFARRRVVTARVFELDPLLRETAELLRSMVGEAITLQSAFDSEGACVRADPSEIQQVVMNLAVNARDAMSRGGVISIGSAAVDLRSAHARGFGGPPPGKYACVTVRDEGSGIPPNVLEHIFDPFFTTKSEGHGTGLGLATAHGIVKQAGGHIEVKTELDRGSTFSVYLPIATEPASPDATGDAVTRSRAGGELVLLVENQTLVRESALAALRAHGYRVLIAVDAGAALKTARGKSNEIDAAVIDVVLPDRNGRELAGALRKICPRARVLLVSGDVGADWSPDALGPDMDFLPKPFAPADLARRVRALIDRR
jgi:PAS domain S-box-containing protein